MKTDNPQGAREWLSGGVVRRDRVWMLAAGAVLSLGFIVLGFFGPMADEHPGAAFLPQTQGAVSGVVAAMIGLLYLRFGRRIRLDKGTLKVDEVGLWCDRVLLGSRSDLRRAVLRRDHDRTSVRIERRRGAALRLSFTKNDDAEAMLRALATTSTSWGVELDAQSPVRAWPSTKRASLAAAIVTVPIAVGAWLSAGGHQGLGPWVLGLGGTIDVLLFVLLFQSSMRVRVGADGIITRWLGQERYLAFSKVEAIESVPFVGSHLVEMRLKGGSTMSFPLSDDEEAQAFAEALESARRADHEAHPTPALATFRKTGASLRDWVVSLRGVGVGANADHRNAPVPRETLLEIVEDPSSPALDRVAAAAALAHSASQSEAERARAAASSIASPKLRVALNWVTDPDTSDEEVSEILAEIEADADLALAS